MVGQWSRARPRWGHHPHFAAASDEASDPSTGALFPPFFGPSLALSSKLFYEDRVYEGPIHRDGTLCCGWRRNHPRALSTAPRNREARYAALRPITTHRCQASTQSPVLGGGPPLRSCSTLASSSPPIGEPHSSGSPGEFCNFFAPLTTPPHPGNPELLPLLGSPFSRRDHRHPAKPRLPRAATLTT